MTTADLVNDLAANGIKLSVKDGKLRYRAPNGAMTFELRDEIAAQKAELTRYVQLCQDAYASLRRGDTAAYAQIAIEAGWPCYEVSRGQTVDLGADGWRAYAAADAPEPNSHEPAVAQGALL